MVRFWQRNFAGAIIVSQVNGAPSELSACPSSQPAGFAVAQAGGAAAPEGAGTEEGKEEVPSRAANRHDSKSEEEREKFAQTKAEPSKVFKCKGQTARIPQDSGAAQGL